MASPPPTKEGAPWAAALHAAAEDEEEDEGEDKMCIVCMDKPRATRFGCGHACCCFDCARTLKAMPEPQAVCPTCRRCSHHVDRKRWRPAVENIDVADANRAGGEAGVVRP